MWKDINTSNAEQIIYNDYMQYLKNRLEEYKKSNLTIDDLNSYLRKSRIITNLNYSQFPYCAIIDKDNKCFFYYMIKKGDKELVNWHINIYGISALTQPLYLDCFTIAINNCINNTENSNEILEMISSIDKFQTLRNKSTQELVVKEYIRLKMAKFNINLPLFDNEPFLSLIKESLSTAVDGDGNTLSHKAIEDQNVDYVYDLCKQNCLSPVLNKNNKNVLTLALDKYRQYTQDLTELDVNNQDFINTKCIYFMVSKYVKLQQDQKNVPDCCDKHKY